MNVLWIVNTLPPHVANKIGQTSYHAISWIDAMTQQLVKNANINIHIACPGNVKEPEFHQIDRVLYIVLPYDCGTYDYWTSIFDKYPIDIVHLYGTENNKGLLLLKNWRDRIPIVISLQGIVTEYAHHTYGGLDFTEMVKNTTVKDILYDRGFFTERSSYEKKSEAEKELLNLAKYVEGRSTWDRVSSKNINPKLNYSYCPRFIRKAFFESEWNIMNVEKHTILISAINSPLKGAHFVIKAIAKLIVKYPDIKLYIAEKCLNEPQTFLEKIKQNGYERYILNLIKKLNLQKNIIFVGGKNAKEMAELMERVNVFVLPSAIENAPNSLAEAMIVGTPSIASFVGGNMDMLTHNVDGLLYCYNEPNMLAEYIDRIFSDAQLCKFYSQNAKTKGRSRHDPDILEKQLLEIYSKIINDFG